MDKLKLYYMVLECVSKYEESTDISEKEICTIIKHLENEGLVALKRKKKYVTEDKNDLYVINNADITMKGLEYLKENSTLSKVYNNLKKVSDLVP